MTDILTHQPTFDLQAHSLCSDGALPPAEVVARAAAAGVELLALTDHDTIDGVAEAQQAASEHGVALVPAAELSAVDELSEDFHVLAYGIDPADAALAERLRAYRDDRAQRIWRMAGALEELGFPVDRAALEERERAGLPVGRPHLAAAAAPRDADPTAFLVEYLIPGRPAYRRRTTPTVPEAIAAIHDAGGVAVWAHPFWDLASPADVQGALRRFAAAGLDGVEAFYVAHDRAQTLMLDDAARELGLLTTGSADFHARDHPHFHVFRAFELHGREPNLGPIGELAG